MSVCLLQFAPEDLIQFDAEISLSPTLELEATEYPTESGNILATGIIRRPREWVLRAKVSDSPLAELQPRLSNGQTRTSAVWSRLRQAQANQQTFTYSDDRDTAEVAFIRTVSDNRTKDSAGSLDLTLTIREMLIAVVRTAAVRAPVKGYGGTRRNNGHVPGNRAPASTLVDASGQVVLSLTANGLKPVSAYAPETQTTFPLMSGTNYNPAAIKTPAPVLPKQAPLPFNINSPAFAAGLW